MTKKLEEYVSSIDTLCGADRLVIADGRGKGSRVIRLYNGKFQIFIKEDKCLDIMQAEYLGENFAFITKNGMSSSELSNSSARGFVNDFDGGLLFTCGLDNIGTPATRNGRNCIQHGSISYLPAENVNIFKGYKDGEYSVSVSGDVKYTALFGSNLVLHRVITLKYLSDEILIQSTITNIGFVDDEFMMLLHFNLGYPLIDTDTAITIDSIQSTSFINEKAMSNSAEMLKLAKPKPICDEEVFSHKLSGDTATVTVCGTTKKLSMTFKTVNLPYLTQWKSMKSGDYVLGIEPTTTPLDDRKTRKIAPSESVKLDVLLKMQNIL